MSSQNTIAFSNLDAVNALLRLRRDRRISWRAFGLGQVIASFAEKGTGEAWPSRSMLEQITGIEMRDISRTTNELEKAGFLVIEERDGRSNIYRLTLGEITTPGDSATLGETAAHPWGKRTQTLGDLAAHNNKEQTNNNETTTNTLKIGKPKKLKPRLKPNQHPTWILWLQVNRDHGSPVPLEEKASLNAAKKLASMIPDATEQAAIMTAYIEDKTDTWAISKGLTLSILVNSRLSKCRVVAESAARQQAEDDAELIRGASEAFPNPDECADFFYQRQLSGLRVPSGVECRPMPVGKEMMA